MINVPPLMVVKPLYVFADVKVCVPEVNVTAPVPLISPAKLSLAAETVRVLSPRRTSPAL
jgi:hypothetical protein